MAVRLATFSLRSKIIALVVASVSASSALIGCLDYFSAREVAVERGAEQLVSVTHFASAKVVAAIDALKNDAFVVSRAPPVQGLIRSVRNGGIDQQEDSTTALWRRRLGQIFGSLMAERPYYTQMRYVGLADHGREIVSVSRGLDGNLVVAAEDQLQQNGDEAYFKEGAKATQSFSLSDITYYSDQSRTEPDLVPTLRLALPIFDEAGRRFGMIVIACNYELFMGRALAEMEPGKEIYVADRRGNYIYRDSEGKVSTIQMAGYYSMAVPFFVKEFMSSAATDHQFAYGPLWGNLHTLKTIPGEPQADIGMFCLMPQAALMKSANHLGRRSAAITVLLLAAIIALAVGFAKQVTQPVALITEKIRSFANDKIDAADLPVDSSDEVGELARAFSDLIERLHLSKSNLSELSARFDSFVAASVDGVVIIDEEGIISAVNPSAVDMFGYEQEELIGQNVSMLMPEPHRSAHGGYIRGYRHTGKKNYIGTIRDERGRHKDGSIIPIALSISELPVGGGRIFAASIRDMTAVELSNNEIRRYAQELERSNKELDQFAYVASHDLKAPLRVIEHTAEWIEEDLQDTLSDKQRKYLTMMRNRVRRMEKLLDDLLDYARVGRSGDDRHAEMISGETMLADTLELLAPPAAFTVTASPQFAAVSVPRMPLQQVIYNLINNAIKHHDREAGAITVDVERIPEFLRFTVRDDGPGIPPEYQQKVFEMFTTLKPRDEVEGSGMGLALVRKTVAHHGGTIEISSGGERGAAFTFTWPDTAQAITGTAAA